MLVFLLDCLLFSKLLKIHQTEGRISNNLLKRKQSPVGKQASCAASLIDVGEIGPKWTLYVPISCIVNLIG